MAKHNLQTETCSCIPNFEVKSASFLGGRAFRQLAFALTEMLA